MSEIFFLFHNINIAEGNLTPMQKKTNFLHSKALYSNILEKCNISRYFLKKKISSEWNDLVGGLQDKEKKFQKIFDFDIRIIFQPLVHYFSLYILGNKNIDHCAGVPFHLERSGLYKGFYHYHRVQPPTVD